MSTTHKAIFGYLRIGNRDVLLVGFLVGGFGI
jgi:hypothetical protein